MDDISRQRLERVEEKVITLEQGQKGLAVRFEQLHGLVQTSEAKIMAALNRASDEAKKVAVEASNERRELYGIYLT
jgi:hypothetical protein